MSDMKSKMPDLKELGQITSKLFKDIKTSVTEIIDDYKQKHATDEKAASSSEKVTKKEAAEEKAVKEEEKKSAE